MSSSLTSPPDVDLRPGRPPVLRTGAVGDATSWVTEHRDVVRAAVDQHGALLVRGLGLRDVAHAGAAFRALAPGLIAETEAFAPGKSTPPASTPPPSGRRTSRCAC